MIERVEKEDEKDADEGAEEADDEGSGLEDPNEEENKEEEGDRKAKGLNEKVQAPQIKKEDLAHPTVTPEHVTPQSRIRAEGRGS